MTGFYMMGTLVVKGLKHVTFVYLQQATETEIIKKINAKVGILELRKTAIHKILSRNKNKAIENKLEELQEVK